MDKIIAYEPQANAFEELPYGKDIIIGDVRHSWQIAEVWTDAELAAINIYRVDRQPVAADQQVISYTFQRVDGVVTQVLSILTPTKDQLTAYAAAKRYSKEVGGMVSQTFGQLFTDRDTRAILAQVIQSIDLNIVTAPINWKGPSGFVALDRNAIVAISTEVVAFVQATFDREAEIDGHIADGTITTYAEIDAAFAA